MASAATPDRTAAPAYIYTPNQVRDWLRRWPLLVSLAESITTSRHQLSYEHRQEDGPCRSQLRAGRPWRPADPFAFADVQADLERAHAHLPRWSLEWTAVDVMMRKGPMRLKDLARAIGKREREVRAAFDRACMEMARYLGYVAPEELHAPDQAGSPSDPGGARHAQPHT